MKSIVKKKWFWAIGILVFIIALSYQQNNSIGITKLSVESQQIPDSFHGFKILQISDLHNKEFGKNQRKLLANIKKTSPDIIFITGDLVDSKKYDEKPALDLISQISSIAPIYYVTGNHEAWSGNFDSLEQKLKELGVQLLRNSSVFLEKNQQQIMISGMEDPAFHTGASLLSSKEFMTNAETYYSILLSHRPELFDLYVEKKVNLTFAGHAHGGQFRIPFVGGLIAPDQGILPQYTAGIYSQDESKMIVSRGLGNSIIPQRILNRPELIVVTLKTPNK